MLEIERKFLLKNLPVVDYSLVIDVLQIEQFYLKSGRTDSWARVRKSYSRITDKVIYYHTVKRRVATGINDEREKTITKVQYDKYIKEYIKGGESRKISKTRHVFKDGKLKWEIDVFNGMSLIVAEVELPRKKYKLTVPRFINENLIMEVTRFNEFGNRNLASKK